MDGEATSLVRRKDAGSGSSLWEAAQVFVMSLAALLLLALCLALSPIILLWWISTDEPEKGKTAPADRMGREECDAYARGYALGVRDLEAYRTRAENAERELERLRRQ